MGCNMVMWMCNKRPLFGLPPGVGLPAPRTIGIYPDEVSLGKPLGSLRRGVLAPCEEKVGTFPSPGRGEGPRG